MSTINTEATKQEKYADKIANLLAKAEATDSVEEAEAIFSKVQQLMTKHMIDEEMIAAARGQARQDEIVRDALVYTGTLRKSEYLIGSYVARVNGVKAYWTESKDYEAKLWKQTLVMVGWQSDIERVKMLDTSLRLQAAQALRTWWKDSEERLFLGGRRATRAKHEFLESFAAAVYGRLQNAKRQGQAEAVKSEAERSKQTAAAASESVALVLRSRDQQVNDWFDKNMGVKLRSTTRRYSSVSRSARHAGNAAGRSANIGQPSVNGKRGAIGGGK
jgi:hypothetical protein